MGTNGHYFSIGAVAAVFVTFLSASGVGLDAGAGMYILDYTAFIAGGSFTFDLASNVAVGADFLYVFGEKDDVTGETINSPLPGIGAVWRIYLVRGPTGEFRGVATGKGLLNLL